MLDGERALADIRRLCALGPRPTGSAAMRRQQDVVSNHFAGLGFDVRRQAFPARPPSRAGEEFEGANLIATWRPDAAPRVVLGAHYDTRPIADNEETEEGRQQPILGANDGGSGVAVLMEISRYLAASETKVGVDFALFDAEELVFDPEMDGLCLGSKWFAEVLAREGRAKDYQAAVVLDIVGREGLTLSPDIASVERAYDHVVELWSTGHALYPEIFLPRVRYEVFDDHVPLLDVGIPSAVFIDVDDPNWHTLADRPEACCAASLAAVGEVVLTWLDGRYGAR